MKSIIVYGDIHGCLDEFKKLRKKIDPKADDIEISVGDFLNKGPYSLETLHYILDHDILAVAGNNEAKIIKLYKRYRKEGEKYLKTIREHEKDTILKITKNELKYLESLPYFLKFSNLTIVHGGIMPDTFIVYGHHPFDEPKIDEYAIGIDTGCVYGGKLTAVKFKVSKNGKVDIKNYKLISVKAKKDYWN